MGKEYFFIYLIYGFAFINMGIFSIQDKEVELSNLRLVKSLKHLGYFGIIHGISEWVTMLTILDLYPELYTSLFILKQLLKASSFAFLMYFGVSQLPISNKYKKYILRLPLFLFIFWISGFTILIISYGLEYHIIYPKFNIILLRYIMAFWGGSLCALALYINAKDHEKRKLHRVAKRYKSLAYSFLIYGFLDGLIVRQMDFFPANIINSSLFLEYFKFPTQILKTILGVTINVNLIKVIDTFGWAQKEKLNRLQNHRIASEERRKLGLEIHDSIIQGLYAAGLKVEYIIKNKDKNNIDLLLKEIKGDLNNTIDKTREFLSRTALDVIELEDLNDNIQQLVKKFNDKQNIRIKFKCEMLSLDLGNLSPEKSTQIYCIVQEAICNIIKHSRANSAEVLLEAKRDFLYIKIIDNGVGINLEGLDYERHFGISSMKERTERVGGRFSIGRLIKGTKIELEIPWEE